MPSDLTIFAAKYLVFIDGLLAAAAVAWTLYGKSRADVLRWAVAAVIVLALSVLFARIGAAVYNDPRPFTVDHVKPLLPHAADNGFPSDHALLAAAIVALVALAALPWCVPFIVLGFLVDWARVGAGIHHVTDVVGSSILVAVATLIAVLAAPFIARWLAPRLTAARDEPSASVPT